MLLDDTKGCPGKVSHMTQRHLGICIRCERLGKPRPHILPAARWTLDAQTQQRHLVCDEARFVGVGSFEHAGQDAPAPTASPSLEPACMAVAHAPNAGGAD
jgi:hypothetical protein